MKSKFIAFILLCFFVCSLQAQVEITVSHTTTGDMANEITTALGATAAATVTKLSITGTANLNLADVQAIASTFTSATLETLDFSNAKFADNAIPGKSSSPYGFNEMKMETVILPDNLETIGNRSFRNCTNLVNMTLPSTLKKIDAGAFTGCSKLAWTSLPDGVETIGEYAFFNASKIELAILPSSLQGAIGTQAFGGTQIAISTIPTGVTTIGSSAFKCGADPTSAKITSIAFPSTLTSLANTAFDNQVNITAVEFKSGTPPVTAAPNFPEGITVTVPYAGGANKAAYEATGFFNYFIIVEKEASAGEELFPVTLQVIDKSKGAKTNHVNYNEENVFAKMNTPFNPSSDWNVFDISAGVNISVWLSQTSNRPSGVTQANYFKESDVQHLKDLGFDHIRLPVDETELFNNDNPRTFKPAVKQHIHNAIGWCQARGMRIILDFHILRSHYFNNTSTMTLWSNPADQALFIQMWEKMSDEFGHYPNGLLAYELLNETVLPEGTPSNAWNVLSAKVITALRVKEPDRMLLIGGLSHNSAAALASLTVPAGDPNLMLVYHFYSPHLLTHYKASWMSGLVNLDVPIHYPGQLVTAVDAAKYTGKDRDVINYYNGYYDKAALKSKMQVAIDRGAQLGLKLFVSETGCIKNTPSNVRTAWMKDVAEIFTDENIAFSIWGWKADFGILENNGTVRDPSTIRAATKGKVVHYNMHGAENPVEKNDTAWIWSVTVQVKAGKHAWTPCVESTAGTINETTYQYDTNTTTNGELQFMVTEDGAVSGTTSLLIPDNTTSMKENATSKIHVYPVVFDDYISVRGAEKSVEIYNSTGRKIMSLNAIEDMKINASALSKGFYTLVVDKKYSYKSIK